MVSAGNNDQYSFDYANFSGQEIKQIASLHIDEIPQGFLSSLGKDFLGLLFSFLSSCDQGILVAARQEENQKIIGFVAGATNKSKLYKEFLRTNFGKIILILLPKLLKLGRIRKAKESLLYCFENSSDFDLPNTELMDMAIEKSYRGKGLARQLFYKFSKLMYEKGVSEFKITTGNDLSRAQGFYEKVGAKQLDKIQIHKGADTLVYLYEIVDNSYHNDEKNN